MSEMPKLNKTQQQLEKLCRSQIVAVAESPHMASWRTAINGMKHTVDDRDKVLCCIFTLVVLEMLVKKGIIVVKEQS